MMPWVLIVILHWTQPSAAMMRFPDKASCENALGWVDDHKKDFNVEAVCLPDSGTPGTPASYGEDEHHDEGESLDRTNR
jgi:hypothetical protein